MTRKEAMRQARQEEVLRSLGFTADEAAKLRRISMTLHRWHEAECNGDIQRDERGAAYRHYGHGGSGPFQTVRAVDREKGALKRLDKMLAKRNRQVAPYLTPYIQTDPRGAALYILRPGDVPAGADVGAYYNRGICVY